MPRRANRRRRPRRRPRAVGRARRLGWRRFGLGAFLSSLVGLVEAFLVAVAVLLGGAFDVGDPFAELAGVGDRLAAADALVFDRFGGVQEPVDLLLRVVGVARVFAFPDRGAHLEVAERVGVAVVDVGQVGLDQCGHHGQLRRQVALLGLLCHPGGDLLLGRVVARVAAADAGQIDRAGAAAGAAGGWPAAAGCGPA